MISKLKWINVALRAFMELGIVISFGYWGYQIGQTMIVKIILCLVVPAVGFGFWGIVDFHQAGAIAERLRLIEELIISGIAAALFFTTGQYALAWILAALSAVHHVMVYLLGEKLLKQKQPV